MTQTLLSIVYVANLVVTFTRGAASATRIVEVLDREVTIGDGGNEPVVATEGSIDSGIAVAFDHAALGALWAPTAGIVNPFQLNVALAEDANVNGVSFRFNSRVSGLSRDDGGCWHVSCSTGDVTCRAVVNAAGVHADELHNLVSADRLAITPRRGQYYVLDTTAGNHGSNRCSSESGSREAC